MTTNDLSEADVERTLRARGLKLTGSRRRILDALGACPSPVTVETVWADLKDRGICVSMATIYRTLNLMAHVGVVRLVVAEDRKRRYQAPGRGGDSALWCMACGEVIPFDGIGLVSIENEVATLHGFSPLPRLRAIPGFCRDCREEGPEATDHPGANGRGKELSRERGP